MIGTLLAELAPRVSQADGVRTTDQTISVAVDDGGEVSVYSDESDAVHLRVVENGRVGWAGGLTVGAERVIRAAFESARAGDPAELWLPAPAPTPSVTTRSPAAATLGVADLFELARALTDRLARRERRVDAWAERSAGRVEVANTRGVMVAYEVSVVGVGASVLASTGPEVPCRVHLAQVGVPAVAAIEGLVAEVERRLAPERTEGDIWSPSARVWFEPRAVATLLAPLLARLAGERWLTGRHRFPALDRRVSLRDDSLAPGRPGSRPIDKDDVPTRCLTLIEGGQPVAGILDLVAASRNRVPPTGHGWRRGFSPPRTGFSNPGLAPGDASRSDLAAAVGEGLVVSDLRFGPSPNPETGAFRIRAPWTYAIGGGEIQGRVEGAELSGNVFELLGSRVVAVGADPTWVGSVLVPSLVLDGVGVRLR